MCGLAGFCGTKPKFDKLIILGILNQSRGIDSTGICFDFDEPVKVAGYNGKGSFEKLCESYEFNLDSISKKKRIIIHTRKATKGAVNIDNAHPFTYLLDNNVKVNFMHNGTITNIKELKEEYKLTIESDVDSVSLGEALVNKKYKILSEYEGAAAAAWFYSDKEDEIYLWNGASQTFNKDTLYYERGLFYVQDIDEEGNTNFYFSSEKDHLRIAFGHNYKIKPIPHNTLIIVKDGKISYKKAYSRDEFYFSNTGVGSSLKRYNYKSSNRIQGFHKNNNYDDFDTYIDDYYNGFTKEFPKNHNVKSVTETNNIYDYKDIDLSSERLTTSICKIFSYNSLIEKTSVWIFKSLARKNINFARNRVFFDGFIYRSFSTTSVYTEPCFGILFLDENGFIYTANEVKSPTFNVKGVKEYYFYKGFLMKEGAQENYNAISNSFNKCIVSNNKKITYYDQSFLTFVHPEMPVVQLYRTKENNCYEIKNSSLSYKEREVCYTEIVEYLGNVIRFTPKFSPTTQYICEIKPNSAELVLHGLVIPSEYQKEFRDIQFYVSDFNFLNIQTLSIQDIINYNDGIKDENSLKTTTEIDSCGNDCSVEKKIETDIEENSSDHLSLTEAFLFIEKFYEIVTHFEDGSAVIEDFINEMTELNISPRGVALLDTLDKKLKISRKFAKGLEYLQNNYTDNFISESDTVHIDNYLNYGIEPKEDIEDVEESLGKTSITGEILNLINV